MSHPYRFLAAACLSLLLFASCGESPTEKALEEYRISASGQEIDFKMQMMLIIAAAEIYRNHVGAYPSTENGIHALIARPEILEATSGPWNGPYLDNEAFMSDPWGRPLSYKLDDDGAIELKSLGPDGVESSDDLIASRMFPDWYKEMQSLAKTSNKTPLAE